MKITPKLRYKYMVERSGLYFRCMDPMRKEQEIPVFCRHRSDGKKFESIAAAREISGKIGGSEIVRVDLLNGDVESIRELMKISSIRNWKGATA